MPERVYDEVLIGGSWLPADAGTYDVINPATEAVAGKAPSCSVAQIEAAARAARAAFEHGPWPRLSGNERGALLEKASSRFRDEMARLVDLVIDETGAVKPVAEAQQVGQVAARLSRYAAYAAAPAEERMPAFEAQTPRGKVTSAGTVVREPVGVVACITPFNFPMTSCAGKIGPALACGNTVVVKPAPQDPLAVIELCRIVDSVLPPGVVNFVNGPAAEIGAALVASDAVDMISFTGSTTVGLAIQQTAARRMKRTLLELGGKSANVVFADADLDRAVASAASVWSFHTGQICIAGTRVLVERSIYADFLTRLVAAAAKLRIGDPREPGVVMGPLVSAAQRERVERYVARGRDEGATLACGGKRPAHLPRGFYYEPTLFADATNDMAIAREEIFGPVVTAIPFRDEDEAVAIANDSDYGLYGFVWTKDTARGLRVASRMRTGTVQVNGSLPNPEAPFGGTKLSGIGRDGGRFAMTAYSELKYIGWTES
jgi:acyl-CoA reductase-like NAD-dependent aldehyde dehydrogenase